MDGYQAPQFARQLWDARQENQMSAIDLHKLMPLLQPMAKPLADDTDEESY